jgi:uncharacterized membrane protein YheB (UPF0754 family)
MSKSTLTNLIALLITLIGYFTPFDNNIILMIGLFSLSGSLTNWLAIHMLFEKVPFLYGSGVIPNNFEDFKLGIKRLIIQEFFTSDKIKVFIAKIQTNVGSSIAEKIDFNEVFAGLTEAIEKSSLGGMLSMVGGKKALEPLRNPIILKLQQIINNILNNPTNLHINDELVNILILDVEDLINKRLQELSPIDVKIIVKDMIEKHLGWLVVWGGIFGGFIGFFSSLLNIF